MMNIKNFSMVFIKICVGAAILGFPFAYIFAVVFNVDPSQLLSCSNQGRGMFFWQVFSRYALTLLSIVMNVGFFLDKSNMSRSAVFFKARTDSLVIGFLVFLVAFVYFFDGVVHYNYFCGNPKSGWVASYVVSYGEAVMLHFSLFFLIFIFISMKKRMSK